MNYESLNQTEKSALEKFVEISQMELLNCADDEQRKIEVVHQVQHWP